MKIGGIGYLPYQPIANYNLNKEKKSGQNLSSTVSQVSSVYDKNTLPSDFKYGAKISFGEFADPNRTVPNIERREYLRLTEARKQRFRDVYKTFMDTVDEKELVDPKSKYLPLQSESAMDEFLRVSKKYLKYKDNPIICLGRSPKWFLNAALWMEDGIKDYTFVAFSGYWHMKKGHDMVQLKGAAPTKEEAAAYKKYLKRIKADPKSIVETKKKTGKNTVITDYVCSGKGIYSWLDLMTNYAEEQGVLEDFANSIQFLCLGSIDYMEELNPYADTISIPQVQIPEKLGQYNQDIRQEFCDIRYDVFQDILCNKNTNECRSTYYPHHFWTVYNNPDKLKIGITSDKEKVKQIEKYIKKSKESVAAFTPAMCDMRNLINFRILDGLSSRHLLNTDMDCPL